MSDEKKDKISKTRFQWRGYFPELLSLRASKKMKSMGINNESQFVCIAMTFYLDHNP